jgi:hypothetical protein
MPNKLSVTLFAIVHGAIVHGAIVLGAMAIAPPLRAEEFKQVQVANTERTNFAPGGLIRLDNSYGDVTVEGWDRPEVEVTVIKSMPFDYAPKHPELAAQHLELVGVAVERRSDTELAIGTNLPPRKRRYAGILPAKTTGGVMLEYLIHVPYDSRLAIRHGAGSVSISDITGDIDASVGRGDIMLWLAPGSFSKGLYSIDAKVKFGRVSSELDGATVSQFVIGERFTRVNPPSPAHRLTLRMGFGGITILGNKPESEATKEDIH